MPPFRAFYFKMNANYQLFERKVLTPRSRSSAYSTLKKQTMTTIHDLLAGGRTAEALEQLQEHIQSHAPKWRQTVLLLRASWAQLEQEIRQGLVSGEEAERRRNRINAGALQLAENLKSGLATPEELWQELKSQFWNENIAEAMSKQEQNQTNISGSNINIEGSSEVIIGSGNTVTKKIFNALGRWQFWGILVVLGGLGIFGYFGGMEILEQQEAAYASLSEIRQELAKLAEERGGSFQSKVPGIEAQAKSGLQALKKGDYQTAIKELSAAADQAPLASLYKDLAYAYEQDGNIEKAYQMRKRAKEIDSDAYAARPAEEIKGQYLNLLASENGGELLASSNPDMADAISENLQNYAWVSPNDWAVFGFNQERPALVDRLDFYIPESSNGNLQSFELQVGMESTNGPFTSVGVFEPQNAYIQKKPFQEFSFGPVEARYIKIILGSPHGNTGGAYVHELRLWGRLR